MKQSGKVSAILVDELLSANRDHATRYRSPGGAPPARRLAVVTCMDVRVDALGALGLHLGEAHVLRNAGGRVTDDVLRSLALSTHALGTRTVIVMQHTDCGLAGVTNSALRERTGADIEFLPIHDHQETLRTDVDLIMGTGFLGLVEAAAGLLYDVGTGQAAEVLRRTRT